MRYSIFSVVVLLYYCFSALAIPVLFSRGLGFSSLLPTKTPLANDTPIQSKTSHTEMRELAKQRLSEFFESVKGHINPHARVNDAVIGMVYPATRDFLPSFPSMKDDERLKDLNIKHVLCYFPGRLAAVYEVEGGNKILDRDPEIEIDEKVYYVFTGSTLRFKKSWYLPMPVRNEETIKKYIPLALDVWKMLQFIDKRLFFSSNPRSGRTPQQK